jgi:hypothetical protein
VLITRDVSEPVKIRTVSLFLTPLPPLHVMTQPTLNVVILDLGLAVSKLALLAVVSRVHSLVPTSLAPVARLAHTAPLTEMSISKLLVLVHRM